jgi:uncharacterized membrane-anchored protein YhcB (DUF1043 family)
MALNWVVGIIIFALGTAAGIVIARLVLPHERRCQALEQELAQARKGQTEYRAQVNQHFKKTAELFDEMTDRYRTIYQHLAAGAQQLCEERPQSLQLDLPGHQKPEDKTPETSPPLTPDRDATVAPQARPGDDIDESYLGDAPQVPELDEVLEATPKRRAGTPNTAAQTKRPAAAPMKRGMPSTGKQAEND